MTAPSARAARWPSSSETSAKSTPDESSSDTTALFGRRVDGRRVVAALTAADHDLPLVARRQLGQHRLHLGGRCAAELQPVRHRG